MDFHGELLSDEDTTAALRTSDSDESDRESESEEQYAQKPEEFDLDSLNLEPEPYIKKRKIPSFGLDFPEEQLNQNNNWDSESDSDTMNTNKKINCKVCGKVSELKDSKLNIPICSKKCQRNFYNKV